MTFKNSVATFRKYGFAFIIQHSFCCILPLLGAFIGANVLPFHNPALELGLALLGALLGVKIDELLHKKDLHSCACHHEEEAHDHGHAHTAGQAHAYHDAPQKTLKDKALATFKTYAFPIIFAFIVWGGHQIFFHKDIQELSPTHHEHSETENNLREN